MDERTKTGRCGWIALGLVVFLLQGLLPGSLMGGVAGLKAAEIFDQGGSDLISRMLVLAGMIMGLLVSAMIIMFLIAAINRIAITLFARPASARSLLKAGLEE